jgi:hypothetical protein
MKEASDKRRSRLRLVIRLYVCIITAGLTLYAYIEKQNELTELRLAIPALAKEVKTLNEENTRLTYAIEQFESPILLMETMRKAEYSHLKYPYLNEEIFLPKSHPL